jgi:hypothetical protein
MSTTRKGRPRPGRGALDAPEQADKPFAVATDYLAIVRESFESAIALLDAKAGILLAFAGAVFIYTIDTIGRVADSHHATHPRVFTLTLLFLGLAAAGLMTTMVLSWTVIKPRIKTATSRFFWKSGFFDGTPEDFGARLRGSTPEELEEDAIIDAHNLASICRAKNQRFGRAAKSGEVALVLFVAGLLLWQVLKARGG